jgi:hypothetical protein
LLAAAMDLPRERVERFDVGQAQRTLASALIGNQPHEFACTVFCPSCGEQLDLSIDLAAVPQSPPHDEGQVFEVADRDIRLRFRLPTAADLLVLAQTYPEQTSGQPDQASRQSDQAVQLLLSRCLVDPPKGLQLSERIVALVEEAMDRVDPGGAVEIQVVCPCCEENIESVLDCENLCWNEVENRTRSIFRDVDLLARAYGWSEADILSLTPTRRASYVELASR